MIRLRENVCMYIWGFRVCHHLRSLVPVMNDEWWWPNDIRGPCGPKASWHLSYRWGKTPKKTSPRKLVLTGDWTRACCVTGTHATAWPTAVDWLREKFYITFFLNSVTCILLLRKATVIRPKYSFSFRFISICLSDAHLRARFPCYTTQEISYINY